METPFGVVGWVEYLEVDEVAGILVKLGVVGLWDAVRAGVCWPGVLFRSIWTGLPCHFPGQTWKRSWKSRRSSLRSVISSGLR